MATGNYLWPDMYRHSAFLCVLLCGAVVQGQQVDLIGGSLHVMDGTTLRFNGPLEFVIQPGASVVNDGIIDLGGAASVNEPVGAPISGAGVEIARLEDEGPSSAATPGGLGLTLTTGAPSGPITITRGHVAREFPEGDLSIARWFALEAPGASGTVDVVMHYDPSELNGLSGSALALFRSAQEDGPWTILPSTASERTVSATLEAPWTFITAFDANVPTASPALFATNGLHVWPTLTTGQVFIHSTDGAPLDALEVFDGLGRTIATQVDQHSATLATMDLSGLAHGPYYLRVNRLTTIKLRKE